MQEFYLRKSSTAIPVRMEVINDGRYDYRKSLMNYSLMDSTVTFSMKNVETGLLKVSKSPADIVVAKDNGCEDKYILQYKWKDRDVKEVGVFEGWFDIIFNGNLSENGEEYLTGKLKVPVEEQLIIYIND